MAIRRCAGGSGINRRLRWRGRLLGAIAIALMTPRGSEGYSTQRVVYVIIDGPRDTECLEDDTHANVRWMWGVLRPQGVVAHGLYNNGPTQSVPGHAMLACGVYQNLPNDGSVRPTRPLLWEYLRDQRDLPDSAAVIVTGKSKLAVLSHSTSQCYGAPDSAIVIGPMQTDSGVISAFKTYAAVYPPTIAMLCLSDVDETAHTGEWQAYVEAIRTADSLAVALWQWLQQTPPFAGVTALVVAADHGRHDTDWTGHGCPCHGCRHLPLVAVGPDFKVGQELAEPPANIWDLAPTLGLILGLQTPLAQGRVLVETLQGETIPPSPPVASISLVDGLAMLAWPPVTTDILGDPEIVASYRVYRGSDAWFLPRPENMISPPLTSHQFVDPDTSVTTTESPVFYRVDAVDIWSNQSSPSAPIGVWGFRVP